MTAGVERIRGAVEVDADVRAVERLRQSFRNLDRGMGTLAKAAAGVFVAFQAASRLGDFISAIQNADNLLRTATDSTTEMIGVKQDLIDIAQRTRTSFFALADGYKRYSTAADAVGLSNQDTIRFTEQLSKVMLASGRSTQEVAAAQTQLGQALGKGKLDGDEFRSLMENMTPLMHLFARELGVSFGELKSLAPQGKITAELMFGAILNQTELINKQFGEVKITASQAFGQMGTAGAEFFGVLESKMGVLEGFAGFISDIAGAWSEWNKYIAEGDYGKKVLENYTAATGRLADAREALAKDPGNKKLQSDVERYAAQVKSLLNAVSLDRLNHDISYTGSLVADTLKDLDKIPAKGTAAFDAYMTSNANPLGISPMRFGATSIRI